MADRQGPNRGRGPPNRNRYINNPRSRSSSTDGMFVAPPRPGYGGAYNTNQNRTENRENSKQNHQRSTSSGSGNRRNDRDGGRRRFGFKKLVQIMEKSPEEALLELISLRQDVISFINTELSNDCIVLLIKFFATVLSSNFRENIADVLRILINPTFSTKLEMFISRLPVQNVRERNLNKLFWDDINDFWKNLSTVCNGLLNVIPKKSSQFLLPILKLVLINLPHVEKESRVAISDETKVEFENLQIRLVDMIENEMRTKTQDKQKNKGDFDEELEPLDDYRDISIYPSSEELLKKSGYGLRKNKVIGGYENVEQYLDIQFRLLREDFVSPLRHGIAEYTQNRNGKRASNIKIYKDTICLYKKVVNSEIGLVIQVFKKGQLKNVERTKRLMFGSLVLFTEDNFKTMIFGKVIDRDITYLRKGQVVINLNNDVQLDFEKEYLMVECMVYFEPYYQVLKALQKINHDRFPMHQYLVDVRKEVELPGYVTYNDKLIYTENYELELLDSDDFDDLIEAENEKKHDLPLCALNTWPDLKIMGFNPAQYNAYKAALTNKFCIIQGPPGTGKTYMGLKIAKLLIQNKEKWSSRGPMLVICYTNHALDQFLEGLTDTTRSIVRVGGQSKNPILEEFNLKQHRRKSTFHERAFFNKRDELRLQNKVLNELNSEYNKLVDSDGIPDLFNINGFGRIDNNFENSWFKTAKNSNIVSWLMEEAYTWNVRLDENPDNAPAEQEEEFEIGEFDMVNQKMKHLDLDEEAVQSHKEAVMLISLKDINTLIDKTRQLMRNAANNAENYFQFERNLHTLLQQKEYLKHKMEILKDFNNFRRPLSVRYANPYQMQCNDRWNLVRFWMNNYRVHLRQQIEEAEEEYRRLYKEYNEIREMYDAIYMKTCDVIGMTTTGAARLQSTLMTLNCPIVIVEEAAEVLEAHIVVALTEKCEHLILIGDHKQLRPSTADFNIETRYNLGISLFERMISNGFDSNTLNIQHRMRPEIAALVCPSIYENLENHASVMNFPPIRGVEKSLYFLTHDNPEKESSDQSKENPFEATYIIMLANYLVLNGYEAEKITILSAYSGQFFQLLKERKQYPRLKELKITILDNYQGEENDIILLSLVRNNNDGQIGFLKLENRVCVALSRAKKGLYILGNIDLLCNNSEIWPKIRRVLEENASLGTALPLICYNHPDNTTLVKNIEDFNLVPEGGCTKICEKLKTCGHICKLLCHILPHSSYKCFEPCSKTLCELQHQCPKLCYDECGECMVPKMETLPCGHVHEIACHQKGEDIACKTIIEAKLKCGHLNKIWCSADKNKYKCTQQCDARIEPCGHACRLLCHIKQDPDHLQYECMKRCERPNINCSMPENPNHKCGKLCYEKCSPCDMMVKKKRTVCSHSYDVKCSEDVDLQKCNKPCRKLMDCGHACKMKCSEPCGNCKVQVTKTIEECQHEAKVLCCIKPTRQDCRMDCKFILKCGHKCKNKCKVDCYAKPCTEMVEVRNKTAPCGHTVSVPCHMKEIFTEKDALKYCKEKCPATLECGHKCSGTCGSCYQGRLHISCNENCNSSLVCGHECLTPCRSMCQPCTRPCEYRCEHSKCTKKCGNACTRCIEECKRKCVHGACNKKCWEFCSVPPCSEPCPLELKCGHNCIGYCGDVCPPKCLVCNEEEVKEIFFGTEDEDNARFVYLQECGHILEGTSLDQWFETESSNNSIGVMVCPKCKTPVTKTQRYSNYIKRAFVKVTAVKKKYEGNKKENEMEHKGLKNKKVLLDAKYRQKIKSVPLITGNWIKALDKFPNKRLIEDCKSKLSILEELCEAYTLVNITKVNVKKILDESLQVLLDYLSNLTSISSQTTKDYPLEMKRFTRITQMCQIMDSAQIHYENLSEYTDCWNLLFSVKSFSDEQNRLADHYLKKFNDKTRSGLNITEKERKEIVAAMGMSTGHWFSCPNGHVYAIGDCGGAMVTSRCNECGEAIGGGSHRLLPTNSLAREMDGAQHPAWSEMANLNNYGNLNL